MAHILIVCWAGALIVFLAVIFLDRADDAQQDIDNLQRQVCELHYEEPAECLKEIK